MGRRSSSANRLIVASGASFTAPSASPCIPTQIARLLSPGRARATAASNIASICASSRPLVSGIPGTAIALPFPKLGPGAGGGVGGSGTRPCARGSLPATGCFSRLASRQAEYQQERSRWPIASHGRRSCRGLSSNGTENLHKGLQASSIPVAPGSRSGLNSPRATMSGMVKA